MSVVETSRLTLRRLTATDAADLVALLNSVAFLANVGDKGVRTLEDARAYVAGIQACYTHCGYGLYAVVRKADEAFTGICGLLYREYLGETDIGYAMLPEYGGRGYASEAAAAILAYGRRQLGLARIVALISPDNATSIRIAVKLGLSFEKTVSMSADGPQVALYS
jgi:RimJ/RimL family protein N-acetyltransferase